MTPRSAAIETRILVVSNNIFRRELLCFQLDEAGYRVYEACDAADAQELISTVPVHILILDTHLAYSEAVIAAARRASSNTALIVITDAYPYPHFATPDGIAHARLQHTHMALRARYPPPHGAASRSSSHHAALAVLSRH